MLLVKYNIQLKNLLETYRYANVYLISIFNSNLDHFELVYSNYK